MRKGTAWLTFHERNLTRRIFLFPAIPAFYCSDETYSSDPSSADHLSARIIIHPLRPPPSPSSPTSRLVHLLVEDVDTMLAYIPQDDPDNPYPTTSKGSEQTDRNRRIESLATLSVAARTFQTYSTQTMKLRKSSSPLQVHRDCFPLPLPLRAPRLLVVAVRSVRLLKAKDPKREHLVSSDQTVKVPRW